jgi:Cdc6-like AAA superfamily ATPase
MKELKPEDYCLDRFDLLLDPELHATIYAGRKDLISKLKRRIDRAYKTGTAMHTLLWGLYGGGKTHTLYYLVNYIKESGYEAHVFHLTCPSFVRKSVVELYEAIIMSLGQKFVYEIMEDVWDVIQPQFKKMGARTDSDKIEIIEKFVNHRDMASVILAYQKPSIEMPYLVWKWLSGERCSPKEKQSLGVITDNFAPMNANQTLLSIINTYSKIKRLRKEKKLLILMIDELEQLIALGEASDFIELFRRLAEQKALFVMLLAYTAAAADAVSVLSAPAVRQRFGFPENYIDVTNFTPEQAKEFIAELFALLRPKDANVAEAATKGRKTTTETVSAELYPFSVDAIEAILTKISASGEPLCPRTIEMALTTALGDALIQEKPPIVVTSDLVSS